MPWSDQNQQNDPWGRGGGGGRQTPPPDLDEVIRRLQERLSGLLGGGGRGSGGTGGGGTGLSKSFFSFGLGILVLVWLASGIYVVGADEEAVVLRFGEQVATTGPGLNWHMPYPIETVEKVPVTRVQRVEIGFRSGAAGMAHKIPQEALMLTKDENIVDVSFIVQYRIKNVSDYLFNVAHPSNTVRGAAESAIREVIGRTMIDDVLTTKKAVVEVEVERLLQSILDDYKAGISIMTVKLHDVQPPQPVIKDFKDVASAREDRERSKNEAEAYANDIIPKARGEAKKMVLDAQAFEAESVDRAEGQANHFISVMNAYHKAPEITRKRLYLDTMQDVLSKVNKVIVDKSVANRVLPYLPLDRMGKKVEVK